MVHTEQRCLLVSLESACGYVSLLVLHVFSFLLPYLSLCLSLSCSMNHDQKLKSSRRSTEIIRCSQLLRGASVMSWNLTVKLHEEDARFSCYRYHSGQPTNQACLSQSGAPILRLPSLELEGVMFPWNSGGNCARLLHSI